LALIDQVLGLDGEVLGLYGMPNT